MKELRKYVNKRLRGLAKQQKTKPLFFKDVVWMEDGPETGTLENFDEVVIGWLEELDKKFEAVEKKVKSYSIMDLAGSVVCPKSEGEACKYAIKREASKEPSYSQQVVVHLAAVRL